MSATYKIAEKLVKFLDIKKMFRKSKEEILEYARKENSKHIFDFEKAEKRAKKKGYYLKEGKIQGYKFLIYKKELKDSDGAVLYLFGGGMITGPDRLDFLLAERIMEKTGTDVWFLFYPLCSENANIRKTYEVCFEAYKFMTKIYKPETIKVLGFSSGACLSLGIFQLNNYLGRPLPMAGKIIAISPGALPDLKLKENKTILDKICTLSTKDIIIDPKYFQTAREIFKGDDLEEYMLDATRGDFSNFPKTYFYYGENECLYAFAEYFEKSMKKYQAPYEIVVGNGMCHCYPLLRFFKEGRDAQEEIIKLLKD